MGALELFETRILPPQAPYPKGVLHVFEHAVLCEAEGVCDSTRRGVCLCARLISTVVFIDLFNVGCLFWLCRKRKRGKKRRRKRNRKRSKKRSRKRRRKR